MTYKKLQDPEIVIESLLNLRNELLEREFITPEEKVLLWKINSCLYRSYPSSEIPTEKL